MLDGFQAAQSPDVLEWPAGVELPGDPAEAAQAKVTFSELQKGRNRTHWKPHHGTLLAETSLLNNQISVMSKLLIKSGAVVKTPKGHLARNPVLDALSMLASLRTQNYKALGLTGGFAERDGAATGQNQARQTMAAHGEADSLLAGFSDALI